MQLTIDPKNGKDPSDQLYEQLRELIVFGTIQPGKALPTQKQIHEGLGLANNTIQRAFSRLTADGLIAGQTSKGTVALEPPRDAVLAVASEFLRPAVKQMIALGLSDKEISKSLNDSLTLWLRPRRGDRRAEQDAIRTMPIDGEERRLVGERRKRARDAAE
jgi:DNA-binding transcriptional regulator YhcF (GntR family)